MSNVFGEEETHPCYGQISVSKYQGDSEFFGSNVTHHGGIIIEVCKASYNRHLSHDWTHSEETLVEVRLSPLQFAELITTGMNTQGVPCTIYRDHNGRVEQANFTDSIEQFGNEYNEDVENQIASIKDAMAMVETALSAKSVKKSDLKSIHAKLSAMHTDIKSNMPYVKKCFTEHVQKSVLEAKTSVESFIDAKVRSLGIKSLKDLSINKKLEEK